MSVLQNKFKAKTMLGLAKKIHEMLALNKDYCLVI